MGNAPFSMPNRRFIVNAFRLKLVSLVTMAVCSGNALAANEFERLGKDLTPVGAEKAGNRDNSIPAFAGSEPTPPGWSFGKLRKDYWQHKAEQPLFVVDASNADKYADKLTPGQIALLKTNKGYTMPVYPTHRTCGMPDFVEQNTKSAAGKAKIGKDGWSLETAVLPSVPFPVPTKGIEAMWNWLLHYEGMGRDYPAGLTYLSPRAGDANPIVTRWRAHYFSPWARKGQFSTTDFQSLVAGAYYTYVQPIALAGQATVSRQYYDKQMDTFYYFPGQRRVRRMPTYAYDTPLMGYENQYAVDQTWIFNGNPDRFDWKIVGKKEVYVPYNSFDMQRFNAKISEAVGERAVNPAMRRYELHRVWEIEGTVKAGLRHSTPKKTIYLDEDTWMATVGDDYDAQGRLWKHKENYIAPQWEVGVCGINSYVQSDLVTGRYILDMSVFEGGQDMHLFTPESTDSRLKESWYTGENLGAISER